MTTEEPTVELNKPFLIGLLGIAIPGTILLYVLFKPSPYCNLWYCYLPPIVLILMWIGHFYILERKLGDKLKGMDILDVLLGITPLTHGLLVGLTIIVINYSLMRHG